jgi:hypothetical protein
MPGSKKQNSMFEKSTGYIQKGNPFPVTSCGRRRNLGSPLKQDEKRKSQQVCYTDENGEKICRADIPDNFNEKQTKEYIKMFPSATQEELDKKWSKDYEDKLKEDE